MPGKQEEWSHSFSFHSSDADTLIQNDMQKGDKLLPSTQGLCVAQWEEQSRERVRPSKWLMH